MTLYALFGDDGAPRGFFDDRLTPAPAGAIEIDPADRDAFVAAPQSWLWRDGARVAAPPPAVIVTEQAVKAECARRIYAVASDNAQKNMMANAIAGNFTADDVTAWRNGVTWISAMQTICRALIVAGDPTYADDSHWLTAPADAAALAARY